jgi:nucleotidyltransferase/DNA polymerase involved in DNA repair
MASAGSGQQVALSVAFPAGERTGLLAVKGIGPTEVQRLEQMGFASLRRLARADDGEIVAMAVALAGSSCWKNSPQARSALSRLPSTRRGHRADADATSGGSSRAILLP